MKRFGVKAVVIDLDGTMMDTITDLAVAVNLMLRELALPQLEVGQVRTFVGKGLKNLVVRSLTAATGVAPDEAMLARAMPIYERCYDGVNGVETTVFPGVREGIEAMLDKGIPLGCITNKAKRFTEPLLVRMGFDRYFGIVLSGDSLPRRKPDPMPLLHAAGHFAVQPGQMLMIGDSLNDAQAARSAGCPIVCVSYGYNEGHDVRTLDIDAIVGSLAEVAGVVDRI